MLFVVMKARIYFSNDFKLLSLKSPDTLKVEGLNKFGDHASQKRHKRALAA